MTDYAHLDPAMSGLDSLGGEQLAWRGADILRQWAMEEAATIPPMAAAVRLLLTPYRAPSPPAPWELARISPTGLRKRHRELVRPWPRKALSRIVPEYDRAVAIYDQRLPEKMSGLGAARAVERHAVAIGIARMIADPVGAAVEILLGCDDFGRSWIEAGLSAWPISIRKAISRAYGRRVRSSRDRPQRHPIGALMERN